MGRKGQRAPALAARVWQSPTDSRTARTAREATTEAARCADAEVCADQEPEVEQASKEGGILVANTPADLVHRRVGLLKSPLRILDTQALDVGNRCEAGRAHETSFEGTFRELGTLDHLLHWISDGEVLAQPLLRAVVRGRGLTRY
jgi:hypothetical protein